MLALIALIVFIILMISWLGYGGWLFRTSPGYPLGNTLIPWVCVLILALFVFNAFGPLSAGAVTTTTVR